MKRHKDLFGQIVTRENLVQAYHRAASGKRHSSEVRKFGDQLAERIAGISQRLCDGNLELGRFHQFVIRDPKERVITAPCFAERVVHHATMNICEPLLDRWLIDDTYACRVGRGREAAVGRAAHFCRTAPWCLKLDVRKYFDSIPHDRLLSLLGRRFKDPQVATLFEQIVRSFRREQGRGLPIGSLMSQHFANFYLGWLDRYVKETLRVGRYVRYMDDMLIWSEDRLQLREWRRRSQEFLADELHLEFKPPQFRRVAAGVSFLGCRLFPEHVELNRRSKMRWRTRVRFLEKAYRLGLVSDLELQQRLTALTAFTKAAGVRSWKFRSTVLQPWAVNEP
jgi:RNA-directed DNA polymerase